MYTKTTFRVPIINLSVGLRLSIYKGINASILIVKTPSKKTIGITSYCKDSKHVLFFDFDGNELDEIVFQLKKLQEYYILSNFYIFENDKPNSYHAICLDKFGLYEAIEIIVQTSADYGFKRAPLRYALKKWVLRCDEKGSRAKPKHLFTLKTNNNRYEKSNAHRNFLKMNYGIRIGKKGFDKEDELDCFEYYTANRIKWI